MKNKRELEDFLKEKPSYQKKGAAWLAEFTGLTVNECVEALKNLRIETKLSKFNDDTTAAAIKYYLAEGEFKKARKLIVQLEQGYKESYVPPEIEKGSYVILGCMHFPFHNKWMWEAVLKIISDLKDLKGIVLAGDILDMHSISRHSKGKITLPDYDLTQEYEETNIELDKLDQAIGNKEIVKEYFYGNHEDWFNQWGVDTDNWKLGEAGAISPYNYCFKKRGYNCQFNWKTAKVMIGDIKVIHGEWVNIHSAYKHMQMLHERVIFFHTHRFNTFHESKLYGLNCGWGGDQTKKVFNYMSESQKVKWKNGFCIVNVTDEGIFPVPLPFENKKFYYRGKIY
jgi:hypothetical protein